MPNLHVQKVIVLFWIIVIATGCTRSNEQANLPETVEINAKLEEVFEGNCYFEGPVWDPYTEKFYFTALRRNSQLLRLDAPGKATVILDRTQGIIGTFLLKSGKILCAQSGSHKILCVALHKDGSTEIEVMAQNFHWNQPNDVCRCPNGMIFFSDPNFKEKKKSAVYCLQKNGKVKKVISNMDLPNGLISSLDGKTLYIGDSLHKCWCSYNVNPDGSLGSRRVFFKVHRNQSPPDKITIDWKGSPDGMTIDEKGNLYFTDRGGIRVVDPDGKEIGLIKIKEVCTNVAFGGKKANYLYITCKDKVYRIKMRVKGIL